MFIRITPLALVDLQDIKKYIFAELQNQAAAENTLRKIIAAYKKLADVPFLGSSLATKIDVPTDYRFLISGAYLIFYKIEDRYISISRIIYGKRDYAKILFGELA
ncbi:toxin ParE [Candidatus Termititenax aidoneus]|uniref:Toxin ParE n=1 Tax=Termititenax aidoneus TaxID=2218524 RepID=A0A388TFQ7_TERA1|nr:toxin ParE [Candidatus Termititenax aidoneus]